MYVCRDAGLQRMGHRGGSHSRAPTEPAAAPAPFSSHCFWVTWSAVSILRLKPEPHQEETVVLH